MEIRLNKSKTRWIDISGGEGKTEIRVDHLTREQHYKLEQIIMSTSDLPIKLDPETKVPNFDWGVMDSEQKAKALSVNKKYMEYFIKYTIKEWRGVKENGKELKLVLTNNEMDDEYWTGFVSAIPYTELNALYKKIESEVIFGDTELKK